MDIVPFLRSCVLDSSKVTNRHYLKTVKSMDYDEFCDVIASVIPDLSITLPLFHCDEWYEFVSFTTIQQSKQSSQSNLVIDEEYVVRDCKVEYPITLIQLDHEQWKLEGLAPHCLSMFTRDNHNGVLNIPLVIEAKKTRSAALCHQTILVFDFRHTKQEQNIAFLYDPNGECSRFDTDDVHYAIETYVNMLNINYKRLHNTRINLYHKSIGGEHCVVCCILFMISYSLLQVDVYQHDAMLLQSKSLLTKLHILLYNALGNELQRFTA